MIRLEVIDVSKVTENQVVENIRQMDLGFGVYLYNKYCKGLHVKREGTRVLVTWIFDFEDEDVAISFAKGFAKMGEG